MHDPICIHTSFNLIDRVNIPIKFIRKAGGICVYVRVNKVSKASEREKEKCACKLKVLLLVVLELFMPLFLPHIWRALAHMFIL